MRIESSSSRSPALFVVCYICPLGAEEIFYLLFPFLDFFCSSFSFVTTIITFFLKWSTTLVQNKFFNSSRAYQYKIKYKYDY